LHKLITLIMGIVICVQSFGIYKLVNKPIQVKTNNVITSSSPQIIYKNKIIYKPNSTDQKILFQTRMFLSNLTTGNAKCTDVNYYSKFYCSNSESGLTVNSDTYNSIILDDMTEYNISHNGKD